MIVRVTCKTLSVTVRYMTGINHTIFILKLMHFLRPFALCDSSLKSADERAALRVGTVQILVL